MFGNLFLVNQSEGATIPKPVSNACSRSHRRSRTRLRSGFAANLSFPCGLGLSPDPVTVLTNPTTPDVASCGLKRHGILRVAATLPFGTAGAKHPANVSVDDSSILLDGGSSQGIS